MRDKNDLRQHRRRLDHSVLWGCFIGLLAACPMALAVILSSTDRHGISGYLISHPTTLAFVIGIGTTALTIFAFLLGRALSRPADSIASLLLPLIGVELVIVLALFEVKLTDIDLFWGSLLNSALLLTFVAPILWRLRKNNHVLTKEKELWQFALENYTDSIWDWNIQSGEVFFSPRYAQMFGFAPGELKNHESEWSSRLHPDDVERTMAEVQAYLAGTLPDFSIKFRLQCKDGSWKWVLSRGKLFSRDQQGKPLRMIGTHTDISQFKAQEEELHLAASVFNQNSESIVITKAPENTIISVNPAFCRITGYTAEEVIGSNPSVRKSGRHNIEFYKRMWDEIISKGGWQGEIWSKRKNGEVFPEWLNISTLKNTKGEVTHYVGISNDISKLKRAEEKIRDLAYYDTLTCLPNRRLLEDRLKLSLANAHRNHSLVALLFMDLDHFKTVNDSLGHPAGDLLLTQCAKRIMACVREGDTVARQGGDEFVLLLPDLANSDDALYAASTVSEKIREALTESFNLDGHEAAVTPSIGIAIYPLDGDNMADLIRNADTAMYHAKKHGRNNYQFYASDMNANAIHRLSMDNALRYAVERNEFAIFYQPQVNVRGEILGAEALLRWNSASMGEVTPIQFIPLAEENGIILTIGKWVLGKACSQLRAWIDADLCPANMRIAVNISPRQFAQPDFNRQLTTTLEQYDLLPHHIELEVTEGMLMQNTQESLAKLDQLKNQGFKISIDDFGTGYSSLAYLKYFPVDVLKIDQSFVRDIHTDPDDAAISLAIIALAKQLNLKVIAEGVETHEQLKFLHENGCDIYQGYHFSHPMPADDLTVLLQNKVTLDRMPLSAMSIN